MTSTCQPKVSVITPSYNQASYLEETIRSVLDQDYPNIEYIIIDGGSTDGSVDIIRKYESRLAYWISEPDRGQTHAINKGMEKATGKYRAYLNSDDCYLPGALSQVVAAFQENPDVDLVYGRCRMVDRHGRTIGQRAGDISNTDELLDLWRVWWGGRNFVQPEVFWTARVAERIGPFREDLHYVMDYEYWTQIFQAGGESLKLDAELSAFRLHANQKSSHAAAAAEELYKVARRLLWDRNTRVSLRNRLKLQADWLFDAGFRRLAGSLAEKGESRIRRWIKFACFAAANPVLLLSPLFYGHMKRLFASKLNQTSAN